MFTQHSFESTGIWQRALASRADGTDGDARARDRLRTVFLRFREQAELLAGEIARSYPWLTVHGITHLDALWETADEIAGPEYPLTAAEAFVLGGAFLVHDLGNGLAAYPRGEAELRGTPEWRDALAILIRQRYSRPPLSTELDDPPEGLAQEALQDTMRQLHAKHAADLPSKITWLDSERREYRLIEDLEIREYYGRIIGLVAESHWRDIDELEVRLKPEILPAPSWLPRSWTVDAVKVACLLRVTDAAHLDDRRAPMFLRALRNPSGTSDDHWKFQAKLGRPTRVGDRLRFATGSPFKQEEARAFWLCFDALRLVDHEIRAANELLAATHRDLERVRPRFAARDVLGVEDARRLADHVCTEGWTPIDARVHVSDVPSLVDRIGGKMLYGDDPTVPLRELIQNAVDAIRARRVLEDLDEKWGRITVRVGKDEAGDWLEVEDTGVGMSERVLTQHLLDFSKPFWGTDAMRSEHARLAASRFSHTGRFGIGFFSVSLLGDRVRVTTRRYDEGFEKARVLEFEGGFGNRPLLRGAKQEEQIKGGGGTRVRVWLREPLDSGHKLIPEKWSLGSRCAWLCPSLDVDLCVECPSQPQIRVVAAQDWITIAPEELLTRLSSRSELLDERKLREQAKLLCVLRDTTGQVVGRAGTVWGLDELGVVTVGGLRACNLSSINGVLAGEPGTAARNSAVPVVGSHELARWASEQGRQISENVPIVDKDEYSRQRSAAQVILACGGETMALPIAEKKSQLVTAEMIAAWHDAPPEVYLVSDSMGVFTPRGGGAVYFGGQKFRPSMPWSEQTEAVEMLDNVLVYNPSILSSFTPPNGIRAWPDFGPGRQDHPILNRRGLPLAIIDALAKAWSVSAVDVFREPNISISNREVGTFKGEPIRADVMVIQNPRARTTT